MCFKEDLVFPRVFQRAFLSMRSLSVPIYRSGCCWKCVSVLPWRMIRCFSSIVEWVWSACIFFEWNDIIHATSRTGRVISTGCFSMMLLDLESFGRFSRYHHSFVCTHAFSLAVSPSHHWSSNQSWSFSTKCGGSKNNCIWPDQRSLVLLSACLWWLLIVDA